MHIIPPECGRHNVARLRDAYGLLPCRSYPRGSSETLMVRKRPWRSSQPIWPQSWMRRTRAPCGAIAAGDYRPPTPRQRARAGRCAQVATRCDELQATSRDDPDEDGEDGEQEEPTCGVRTGSPRLEDVRDGDSGDNRTEEQHD